jgi:hypothetical protein
VPARDVGLEVLGACGHAQMLTVVGLQGLAGWDMGFPILWKVSRKKERNSTN